MDAKPAVVVTGLAGNLGSRLLPLLRDFSVIGVDINPLQSDFPLQFEQLDLGAESSTRALYELLRETHPVALIHLAFVIDPVRAGVLDTERMWQINVAGTARVMEAITESNRTADTPIRQFIYPSSVAAYGPSLPAPATEESVLAAHTLPYAIHKKQSDEVVQQRASSLRGCSVYILRPPIFAGATVENYMLGAFRGTPNGKGPRAEKCAAKASAYPACCPAASNFSTTKSSSSTSTTWPAWSPTSSAATPKPPAPPSSTSPDAATPSPSPAVSKSPAPNSFASPTSSP
jgi:UDP-glucose 4-epimerase